MFNTYKLAVFVLASLLYFITLCVNVEYKLLITLLYIILILVGLYDLGKDDVMNEDKQQSEKIN